MPATMDDFLNEGVNELPSAPDETPEQRRKRLLMEQGYAADAALADVPYGTPTSAGGTATHFQVTNQTGPGSVKDAVRGVTNTHNALDVIGADGEATPIATYDYRLDPKTGDNHLTGAALTEQGANYGSPTSAAPSAVDAAAQAQADAEARQEVADEKKANALQDIIDRHEAANNLDTTQQDESRAVQKEALSQNRILFSKANSYDPKAAAAAYSEAALSHALAVARSAPGGASRESALMNALEAQPAAQAEGQRQANSEGRAQQSVALQASNQLGQLAGQTRSQDEGQAEFFTSTGLDVAKSISNFIGADLNLDQRDREFLGEVALQVANLDLDVEKLGVDESLRRVELALQKEGLDQEWKQFKQSQKITGKDILGGIFGLGGSVLGGLFTGLAAKK